MKNWYHMHFQNFEKKVKKVKEVLNIEEKSESIDLQISIVLVFNEYKSKFKRVKKSDANKKYFHI